MVIEPVHCGYSSILKVRFFGDTMYVQKLKMTQLT